MAASRLQGAMQLARPSDVMGAAMKQAGISVTIGVFIGSAMTSGIAFGLAAAWLANERVIRRLKSKAVEALSSARDAALSTQEGQALQRVILQTAGEADDDVVAAPAADVAAEPIQSFADARLSWSAENGEPGGAAGGRWACVDGGKAVTISPAPGLDYWCKTFYTPLLVKTDGQALMAPIGATNEATLTTAFTLSPAAQFDQAGVMILVDARTWVKAGIEFVDGHPRLAMVVTNDGYSDWSTAPWPQWDAKGGTTGARVRISKLQPGGAQGGCVVFEAAPLKPTDTSEATADVKWSQVRIASLRAPAGRAWRMGVYGQSPVKQSGCSVRFHHLRLGAKVEPVHEAALPDDHAMRVSVRVRDAAIWVDVGPGHQRLKWLAMVALQRYAAMASADGSIQISHAHVATGLMDAEGNELPPNKSVRVALADGQEVFALLQADEDDNAAVKGAKGTSRFMRMQGAAPNKCIISGPGVTYTLMGQAATFSLQARDTYGNLTTNGGEKFEVKVSMPDSLTGKALAEAEKDPPATITDRGDGSYLVSHTMTRKGRYDVSVELDGEPIAGSPFATVAVKTFVPPMIKWQQPRISSQGAEPSGFSHAAVCTYGRSLIVFGGRGDPVKPGSEEVPFHNTLFTMHVEKMRWEVPKVTGVAPSPRGGCVSCLSGNRLLVYGGEIEGDKEPPKSDCTPSDELWSLDLEAASWTNCSIRGVSPGPLSFGAAACVGNKAYFFGGWTGSEASNGLFTLDAVSLMWEPVEDNPSGPRPTPRWGHSLLAVEDKLFMYGGRDHLMHFATLSIYDTTSETWSMPQTRGDICRERAFHSSLLWGRNLVIGLGSDGQHDANIVSMLNLDTLYWDSWDGNVARSGAAMGLLEGKLLTAGGAEGKDQHKDMHQFNMGGFMMTFDGVDDEIMIPHLPTIITTQYTIEAWVRPSKVGPMNIVTRSDESYPMAAWSHQLRINHEGKFEHYLEADDKYTVSHTAVVEPGKWYHVAGVAVADDEMRLFVDGQEEGNSVHVGALRQKLDRYFVGSASGDGMGYFEGNIAEVRVWNLPRPEEEIQAESRKVLNGTERGIVGYWRINEGPGAMVFDFSSYNNVGPIKGEPDWTANRVPLAEAPGGGGGS